VLRLDELPKPADAADALAIALCHAWRGGAAAGGTGGARQTPAQLAWAEAEKRARVSRTKVRSGR
jgi:crossover junction endodeoxyribonuclease RuvC